MIVTSITFERRLLYDEVWAEPMIAVAKRYSLSDVGLRKICKKLDVPVPPRGYWAKLAAGRRVVKTPLPKNASINTYVRSHMVPTPNAPLESRLEAARANEYPAPQLDADSYVPPADLSALGKEAALIAKETRKLKEQAGAIQFGGRAWVDISVSPGSRERALRLLDQLAEALKAIGCRFDLRVAEEGRERYRNAHRQPEPDRGHFSIYSESYFVKIKERIRTEEVVKPAEPASTKSTRRKVRWEAPSSTYQPKEYVHSGTGMLHLSIVRVNFPYEIARAEDTPATVVEDKIFRLAQKVEEIALRAKLESELRAEEVAARRQQSLLWQQQKAAKDQLLKKLQSLENLATRSDRATSLRALAQKILEAPAAPSSLKNEVSFILKAADWLDPFIETHWEEIDDVPDHNPAAGW